MRADIRARRDDFAGAVVDLVAECELGAGGQIVEPFQPVRVSEHHENILVDTSRLPNLLAKHGIDADVTDSFGSETLPPGLRVVIGTRRAPEILRQTYGNLSGSARWKAPRSS